MMVTSLYAGLLAIWYMVLSARVIAYRGEAKINLGDGGNATMLRRIRGHSNFGEYVPLALVLMGLLELGHASIYELHAIGLILLAARLIHGIALSFTQKWQFGRFWGTLVTFILIGVMGLQGIWMSLQQHMAHG